MTRIIAAPPPGTLNIKGVGVGFPTTHNSSRVGGNGFINSTQAHYYLIGISGNTAADSVQEMDWTIENAGLSLPWNTPFAYTYYQVLVRNLENRSVVCLGMIGGLPAWNAGLDFDQWSASVLRKRAGIVVERDAGGVIVWRLAWSNAVTQSSKPILAIPDNSWVSIIYNPTPRSLQVFVNGNLWDATTDANLPTGAQTDGILFTIGAAKKLITAPEVSLRIYAPAIMPALTVL